MSEKISLRDFWTAVEKAIELLSPEKLRDIVRGMARDIAPGERDRFLQSLRPPPGEAPSLQKIVQEEDLINDIEDCLHELEDEMESSEEPEDSYFHSNDDEDSLGPYVKFLETLSDLFDRADAAFDSGHLRLAGDAYEKLMGVFELEDDYGRGIRAGDLPDFDFSRTAHRFCRAVYELEPEDRRAQTLFEVMKAMNSLVFRKTCSLEKVIGALSSPLSAQEVFLQAWIDFLKADHSPEADTLLREAVSLAHGPVGLGNLAAEEGKRRPRVFLDWCQSLAERGSHVEAVQAAQQALTELPPTLTIRASIADLQRVSATKLGDAKTVKTAQWEGFVANPSLVRILDLYDSVAGQERESLMGKIAQSLAEMAKPENQQGHDWVDKDVIEDDEPEEDFDVEVEGHEQRWLPADSLLVFSYCLGKKFPELLRLGTDGRIFSSKRNEKRTGVPSGRRSESKVEGRPPLSDDARELLATIFLAMLSRKAGPDLPPNLAGRLAEPLRRSSDDLWSQSEDTKRLHQRTLQALKESWSGATPGDETEQKILQWCLEFVRDQVSDIVTHQHRQKYKKAAELVAACCEVLSGQGKWAAAGDFSSGFRLQFPSHSAFRKELAAACNKVIEKKTW